MDRSVREYINTENLQNAAHALLDSQCLIEYRARGDTRSHGDYKICADCDPDLRLHGPACGTQPEERLHAKVLLDPLEEEFPAPAGPASFVDHCDDQGIDLEVVGYKDKQPSRFRVSEAYPSQVVRVVLLGLRPVEAHGLVGPETGRLVPFAGLADVEAHVGLGPGDEEGPGRMYGCQSEEIDVSAIQYVEGSGFESDPVQGVDVVDLPVRDRDEHWDRAAQVDHGVDDLVEIQYVSIRRIQFPDLSDENLGEFEVDLPASMLVCVREIGSRYRPADAHGVKQVCLRPEAGLDVAEALPEGELSEGHAKELVPRGEAPARSGHGMFGYAALELLSVDGIGKQDGRYSCQPVSIRADPNGIRFKCVT